MHAPRSRLRTAMSYDETGRVSSVWWRNSTSEERQRLEILQFRFGRGTPVASFRMTAFLDGTRTVCRRVWNRASPSVFALSKRHSDQPWIEGYTDGYATTSPVGSF